VCFHDLGSVPNVPRSCSVSGNWNKYFEVTFVLLLSYPDIYQNIYPVACSEGYTKYTILLLNSVKLPGHLPAHLPDRLLWRLYKIHYFVVEFSEVTRTITRPFTRQLALKAIQNTLFYCWIQWSYPNIYPVTYMKPYKSL